jgi:hypothetical protein
MVACTLELRQRSGCLGEKLDSQRLEAVVAAHAPARGTDAIRAAARGAACAHPSCHLYACVLGCRRARGSARPPTAPSALTPAPLPAGAPRRCCHRRWQSCWRCYRAGPLRSCARGIRCGPAHAASAATSASSLLLAPPPLALLPLPPLQRSSPPLARVPLLRRARPPPEAVHSRRPSAKTVLRTWRATGGLLREEEAASGEEGWAGAAAGAAAADVALAGAWEGKEQEMSNLQDSTTLILVVRSSIFTLIELRGWQWTWGNFLGFLYS